ncbi:endospore germination permease [Lysinibacillus sp. KU-BSD001]|uniref:GerAB/ArcD/ProY family transporter n=1 Tax=Lysinibacillus sp. KU-BSD001 TaxID=3141328 RepID=UPI0036EE89E1
MEKQIISSRQFTIIVLFYSVGTSILIIPASIALDVKQDAWIVPIIGTILSVLLVKLLISLGKRMPTLSFVEMNEKILGKFIGKCVSIGFIVLTLLSASELLYFMGNFLQTEVMIETPQVAFSILFSITILFAAYLGIEVFARSLEILLPFFVLIFIIFVLSISPQIDSNNIQPFFEVAAKPLIYNIFYFVGLFSFPLVVLLMIFPSAVNVYQSAQKGFYIGMIAGGLILSIVIALCILVLGAPNTSLRTFPSYALAQKISVGNFVQRIEIIMAFMWWITIFVRAFMYFYACVKGLGEILKLKDHRPLILPLGMISIGLSQIMHPNVIHSATFNKETWPLYIATFAIVIPLILLTVVKLRKMENHDANGSESSFPK